jgi:hypothetical protein
MSRTRALLHFDKLDDFAAWAATKGWVREPTKGAYEVLRLRKENPKKKRHRKPVIFYKRPRSDHATIGWDQQVGVDLVKQWLWERRASERA